MTQPLVRSQRTIESRLRALGQRLNDELGFHDQRLRFTQLTTRSGPTRWALRNQEDDATGVTWPVGAVVELASAVTDDSVLCFSYNEEWRPVRARDKIEFVSSNLRFVVVGIDDTPDLRFRLEWAGAKTEGSIVSYPGVGAAHPHWQFDVDAGWFNSAQSLVGEPDEGNITINLEPTVEDIELEGGLAPDAPTRRLSATMAGFHRLHLPARSMWHELLCVMPDVATPQQHTPAGEEEIDRWVISALRYLRSEFQNYM